MAIKTVSRQRVSVGSAVSGSSYGTTIPITTTIVSSTNPVISALYITDSSYNVIDDTAVNSLGGYIKLIGTNFTSGCTVYINGQAAPLTIFVSSTEVRALVNAGTAGSTFSVMLFNNPTQGAIWGSGLYYSGFPSLGLSSYTNLTTNVNVQLPATGDSALVYSLKSGSSLPAGVTLSSTGLISGTATGVSTNSVFTFTILINDSQLQTTQVDITLSIIVTDANFNSTTLSLTNNGINNANNTSTFKDYSFNNYVSTGTGTNSSFSPFGLQGWSGYFNNTSSDFLTVGSVVDWTYLSNGTSDYTIEAWVYPLSTSTASTATQGQTILTTNSTATMGTYTNIIGTGTSLSINDTLSGDINFVIYNNSSSFALSTSSYIKENQWQHIAVTVTTSTKTANLYYNGTPVASYTSSTFVFPTSTSSDTLNIGRGVTINPLGDGGSLSFNGTNDYFIINTGASQAFTFGTSDFTIECWFNLSGTAGNYTIYDGRTAGTSVAVLIYFRASNNLSVTVNGVDVIIMGGTVSAGVWHHMALSRVSGSTKLFLDGVQIGSTYTDANNYISGVPTIGRNAVAAGGVNIFSGYITNLRIIKGTGLYANTFIPPTKQLTTATTTASLLLNVLSSSTYLNDSSGNGFTATVTGNVSYAISRTRGNYFNGFISDVRIVKGLPVYTGTFTVATSALGLTQTANPYGGSNTQPISTGTYTTLSTLQSYRFADASTGTVNTGSRVTQFNNASIQPFSPYPPTGDYSTSTVGGSIYFNGTSDFINSWGVPTLVGGGNVTCEAWIYPTTTTNANMTIGSTYGPTSPGGGFRWWINPTGGMTAGNGTQNAFGVSGLPPMYNQWNHVALVRENGWCMGYLNGRKISASTDIGNFGVSAASWGTGFLQVGTEALLTRFQGYISNFRYIRDTALYNTSTFSYNVPTAQFTATSTGTAVNTATIVGTATLILLKGVDAGIYDATSRKTIITSNQVRVSTGVTRYGTGSVYFPGLAGNRLIVPSSPLNLLSITTSSDFTIELWVYPLSLSTNVMLVSQNTYSTGEFFLRVNSDGSADFSEASTAKITFPIGSVITNLWQHIAIVRASGSLQGYVNGIRVVTSSSTYAYSSTGTVYIGSNPATSSQDFNGYIDDLRISRVARYNGTTFNTPITKFLTR